MSERLRLCPSRLWQDEWLCGLDREACGAVWPRDPGACPRFGATARWCPECAGAGAGVRLARDRKAGWFWCAGCGAWFTAAERRAAWRATRAQMLAEAEGASGPGS